MPSHRGRNGKTAAYNLKQVRRRERELAEQAERSYRQLVADWQAKAPAKAGVAASNGTRLQRPSVGQAGRQASVPEPAIRSVINHALTTWTKNVLTATVGDPGQPPRQPGYGLARTFERAAFVRRRA